LKQTVKELGKGMKTPGPGSIKRGGKKTKSVFGGEMVRFSGVFGCDFTYEMVVFDMKWVILLIKWVFLTMKWLFLGGKWLFFYHKRLFSPYEMSVFKKQAAVLI
jgi:hypothetical protein